MADNPYMRLVGAATPPDAPVQAPSLPAAHSDNPYLKFVPNAIPQAKPAIQQLVDEMPGGAGMMARLGLDYLISSAGNTTAQRGKNIVTNVGRGVRDIGQGLKQVALEGGAMGGLSSPGAALAYTRTVDAANRALAETPEGRDPFAARFRTVAKNAPYGLLGPVLGSEAGLLSKMALSSAVNAGVAGTEYVPEGESRRKNIIVGAATGAAVPFVPAAGGAILTGLEAIENQGLGNIVRQGAATVRNLPTTARNKLANARLGILADPESQELYGLSQRYNVPTMASDITRSPAIRSAGEFTENVPFYLGTRGFRKTQMEEANRAANEVQQEFGDIMNETPFGGRTGIRKLEEAMQSDNPTRAQAARKLADEINNAGDDWHRIIKASGNLKLFRAKLIADRKYNRVAEIADKVPGGVPTMNILKALSSMIRKEESSVIKDRPLLANLHEIRNGLMEQVPGKAEQTTTDPIWGTRTTPAVPPRSVPRRMTYSQIRDLRSDLNKIISDKFSGSNSLIGPKGVGNLQALSNQIDTSLNVFASRSPNAELRRAAQSADNFYRTAVIPFKDKMLAQSLKGANADEIYGKFIQYGQREGGKGTARAQRFYQALDSKGQAAVRYNMVSDAYQKALKEDTQQFSPALFASHLDRFGTAYGVIFRGQERAELDGFKKLMRSVERSHIVMNKPETGYKAIPYIMGAAVAGTGKAISFGAFALAAKKLMTTDFGKRLLLSASKAPPNSAAMRNAQTQFLDHIREGELMLRNPRDLNR